MIRMVFAGASALILSSSVAWAECAPETWQDCAGKPWVDGDKMETPLGTIWWPNAQWGEGVCFLRAPRDTTMRPVYTGWFSDFEYSGTSRSTLVLSRRS